MEVGTSRDSGSAICHAGLQLTGIGGLAGGIGGFVVRNFVRRTRTIGGRSHRDNPNTCRLLTATVGIVGNVHALGEEIRLARFSRPELAKVVGFKSWNFSG